MEETDIPSDLKKTLDDFQLAAEQVVNSFLQALKERSERESPKIIYHYTNDIGLKGIVESGQLWMNDIFSLNDPSELRYGLSHAVSILNDKAGSGSAEIKEFAERFENFYQDGPPESAHFFTCSFSSNGDDLGQWRAYADDGRGYALGFDAEALVKIFEEEPCAVERNIYVFPISYEERSSPKFAVNSLQLVQ